MLYTRVREVSRGAKLEDSMSSKDAKFHRVALERWRTAFDAYLKAVTETDRRKARDELVEFEASAESALKFVRYDVAVPSDKGLLSHGLVHVIPWLDSLAQRNAQAGNRVTKIEMLDEYQSTSFASGLILMLDQIILELDAP